eukprot:TRINITY_DN3601_c0_g1_i1.p1 TRINITY_DN3601_c0_g1~~TRINITY_DN3601_c0_g1_i1.p1  ORF type:complete len:1571 (+),score=309.06 TRINITY_DN3601_c0_g1_i1:122-4714(+)
MVQTSTVGAVAYLAPEVMGGMNYTTHSDVFSFAVCAWEIITGNVPYEKESVMRVHQLVMTGKRLPFPSHIPKPISEFISVCWRENPETRPSFAQIIARISDMLLDFLVNGTINDYTSLPPDTGRQNRKLYGSMDSMVKAAHTTKLWKNGNLEIIAISGPSGIGKTTLMKRISDFAAVQAFSGYGKWHGSGGLRPYQAIIEALTDVLSGIKSHWSSQQIEQLRNSLLFALGESGLSVLEGVLPQLPKLIKYDAGVAGKLRRKEADSNHLQFLLLQFLRQLATEDYPLLLSLDNAQWADISSLQLLRQISKIPHLLLLIAYVPEVQATTAPTIETILKQLKKSGVPVTDLPLSSLTMENVLELLTDFMKNTKKTVADKQDLASKLLKASGGNPFDCWHMLLTQNILGGEKEKEKSDHSGKDKDETVTRSTAKIAEIELNLLKPLQNLNSSTAQRLVFLSSCLNCNFGVDTLLLLRNKFATDPSKVTSPHRSADLSSVKKVIDMCVEYSIFVRVGESELYTWVNDKIRDSVYQHFGMTMALTDIHLELAQALSEAIIGPKPPSGVDFFEVAHQYSKSEIPPTDAGRFSGAKVLLRAANECIYNLKSWEIAHSYCLRAVEFLGLQYNTQLDAEMWATQHQLCWDAYITLLDCEKDRGDDKVAAKIIQQLGRQSSNKAETSKVFLEMIRNIEMKMRREETLALVLDYLHFHGLRKDITSAQSVFDNPAIVDKLRKDVNAICRNDISSILISDEVAELDDRIEDLHSILLIGLDAAASLPHRHMSQWMLYELVLLYSQHNKLRRHLKPCLMLALELEEAGDRRQAEKILRWRKPFVTDLGSLPELQQVPTLEVVANAYWSEFPASYMIEHYINPAINIGIRQNSFHHVGYHFSNRFILHFAMGNWSLENIAQTFHLPLARKLTSLSSKCVLLFDIYSNGIRFLKTRNLRCWVKAQEILKDITPVNDHRYWMQAFFFWFADVVYDSGIEMTQLFFSKGLCASPESWLSGTYLAPFVWWCSSMQLFRYVLRTTFLDPNREEFLRRARDAIPIVQLFERGGNNLAPHLSLLEALSLSVSFMEQQQQSQSVYSNKKEKEISRIIFKFNKTLTVARESGHAWLYAITCEAAAEFYEQMMLKPLAKAHLEEAITTYTALDATAKVKQLETILTHTGSLLPSSPSTVATLPAWPFLSRLTRALLSYPETGPQAKLRDHIRSLLSYFETLAQSVAPPSPNPDIETDENTEVQVSENETGEKEVKPKVSGGNTHTKKNTIVSTSTFLEDLCELLSRVFEERKLQLVPVVHPLALEQIRGNIPKLSALLLFLIMGYVDSLEDPVPSDTGNNSLVTFVFLSASKQPTGTNLSVYIQDYCPPVLPWDSEEKEEASDLPSELQTAFSAVSPIIKEFSLTPFYSTPQEHSKLCLNFCLQFPKLQIGVAMDPSNFVYNLTTQFLNSSNIAFTAVPKINPKNQDPENSILPRHFLDKVELILVDDAIGAQLDLPHLQQEEKKKIVVVTRTVPGKGYNDYVLLSHLSKLSTIL